MLLELIQGEGGFNSAPREFFTAILNVLREHDIRIWFDEIQTLGRTNEIFAYQSLKLNNYAELVTFGKMSQVCGTLYQKHLKPKPGLISQTFTSSSSAIEAAINTFKILLKGRLYGENGTIASSRKLFESRFDELHEKYPDHFNGPHGQGSMYCFVYDDGSMEKSQTFLQSLFKAGVIAFLAGVSPVKIRFLPPMGCLDPQHIHQVCDILDQVIGRSLDQ
jgi:acetylornithine aminotransferase